MISENASEWIWLTQALGYNNHKLFKLYELYADIKEFIDGGEREWRFSGILSSNDIEKLKQTDTVVSHLILERCKFFDYSVITIDDEQYPDKLRHIYAPPAVLYAEGQLSALHMPLTIGVVGTRTASSYGTTNSYKFGYALSKSGVATVSGGALGVDCACHRGSLAANGVTVCVRGCGINHPYLIENAKMRQAITQRGAVISEYPPDDAPKPYHFPARNRIIAGLCDGLLVIEAGEKSGSLITVNLALDMGKEIFALLGNNSPQNKGSNERIKEGTAIPVTDFMDILAAFNNRFLAEDEITFDNIHFADMEGIPVKHRKRRRKTKKQSASGNSKKKDDALSSKPAEEEKTPLPKELPELTEAQEKVYQFLSDTPTHIDTIAEELGIPVFKVLSILSQLEMKDLVSAMQGRNFKLK